MIVAQQDTVRVTDPGFLDRWFPKLACTGKTGNTERLKAWLPALLSSQQIEDGIGGYGSRVCKGRVGVIITPKKFEG